MNKLIPIILLVLSSSINSISQNTDLEIFYHLLDSNFFSTNTAATKVDIIEGQMSVPSEEEKKLYSKSSKQLIEEIIGMYNRALLPSQDTLKLFEFHTNVVNQYQLKLKLIGDDKVKHFDATVGLTSLAYFQSYSRIYSLERARRAGIRKGLLKELLDKNISQEQINSIISEFDSISRSEDLFYRKINELDLDEEDLIADIIGADLEGSLLGFHALDLKSW